ncbi:hypothetical protein STZ1_10042 [Bacillus subtilis]
MLCRQVTTSLSTKRWSSSGFQVLLPTIKRTKSGKGFIMKYLMNPKEKMSLKQQERLLINIFELVGGACVDSTGTSFWTDGKSISRYFSARSSRTGHMEAKIRINS